MATLEHSMNQCVVLVKQAFVMGRACATPLRDILEVKYIPTDPYNILLTIAHIELEHFICWPWGSRLWNPPEEISGAFHDGEGVARALGGHLHAKGQYNGVLRISRHG